MVSIFACREGQGFGQGKILQVRRTCARYRGNQKGAPDSVDRKPYEKGGWAAKVCFTRDSPRRASRDGGCGSPGCGRQKLSTVRLVVGLTHKQTRLIGCRSRALDIPKENSDADAKFVKVTLPLPIRWKKRDVLSRDPVPFLREVHNYALCLKQACSRMLGASLDGELRHAYELVTERLREENHAEVSWEQAVQVFKMLVAGKDLCDPEHDAMIKITRGEIKQGKEETTFDYSVKFRHNVFAAPAIPVITVCDKFVTGMYSPEMPM